MSGLLDIKDVFDNEIEFWIGYPLTRSAVLHRPNIYLQERCKLAEIFEEIHKLMFADDRDDDLEVHEFGRAVDLLCSKMQNWYERLPSELHYEWPISTATWELQ